MTSRLFRTSCAEGATEWLGCLLFSVVTSFADYYFHGTRNLSSVIAVKRVGSDWLMTK